MLRPPAEFTPRLLPTEPLIERIAARPCAEFGGDYVGGNDPGVLLARTETSGEGARDPAHRKPIDRRADVARSRRSAFEHQCIEIGKVLAMDQRPAHRFAVHDVDGVALAGLAGKTIEHTTARRVDHGR